MPFDALASDPATASKLDVVRRETLSPSVLLLRLRHERKDFVWMPGQHIEIAAPSAPSTAHFYSIASAPDLRAPGEFELVMSLSASPALLRELEPGRTLLASQPRGQFVWQPGSGPCLFVGIGTGISPLRAMLQAALSCADLRVTVMFGARTESDLLFKGEFEALAARETRFRFEPTLSRAGADWRGARGRVQDHLERVLRDLHPTRAFVCGTTTMVHDTMALLHEHDLPAGSVLAESYGG
jgi:CDP-4-dehydro-6-deoxyglucose reductase